MIFFQIKQERVDESYEQSFRQFVIQQRPRYAGIQPAPPRAPIGINLSTGDPVFANMGTYSLSHLLM